MLQFSVDNGIPSNTVYNLYRDSKGFIWVATDKGIARYNGTSFKKYTTSDGLPDNEVFFFKEDCERRIWMATFNGSLCYYRNGRFYNSANTPFLKLPVKASSIFQISIEKDSSIVMSFWDEKFFLNIKETQCRVYPLYNTAFDVRHIYKLSDTEYNVMHIDSQCLYNIKNGTKQCTQYRAYKLTYIQNHEYFLNDRRLYSRSHTPLHTINTSLKGLEVYDIMYSDSSFFYATDKGLIINTTDTLLSGKTITSITEDINGNYWISTLEHGIFTLNKNFRKTTLLKNAYKGIVNAVWQYKGVIYFATSAHILYKLQNNQVTLLYDLSMQSPELNNPSIAFHNGVFYGIEKGSHLIIFDVAKNNISKRHISQAKPYFKKLLAAHDGLYFNLAGTVAYIPYQSLFNGNTEVEIIPLQHNLSRVFTVTTDKHDIIWYSGQNTVYKIVNEKSVLQKQFGERSFKWFKIFNNYFVGCTHTNELFVRQNYSLEQDRTITTHFNNSTDVWLDAYYIDKAHVLLLTSGTYKILTLPENSKTPSIHEVENLTIPRNCEYFYTDSLNSYFFKKESITILENKSVFSRPVRPFVQFKTVATKDSIYFLENSRIKELNIPYEQSGNIRIVLEALSYGAAGLIYEYAIEENGKYVWLPVNNSELNLVLPKYGQYIIKIRAKTLSSVLSNTEELKLIILNPFWATSWFLILVISVLLLLTTLSIRFFIDYTLKRKERLHKNELRVLKSEFRALNALMNPHFIFNTLNNVQGLILNDDKLHASRYLHTFSELVRQNMQNVTQDMIPLQKELNLIDNYLKLEKFRFGDKFNYEIEIDDKIETDIILIPPLLIQPLIENSIKHGILPGKKANSTIKIIVREENDIVYIEVIDNGVGFTSNKNNGKSHQSLALANIKQRAKQLSIIHNMDIEFYIDNVMDSRGQLSGAKATIKIAHIVDF